MPSTMQCYRNRRWRHLLRALWAHRFFTRPESVNMAGNSRVCSLTSPSFLSKLESITLHVFVTGGQQRSCSRPRVGDSGAFLSGGGRRKLKYHERPLFFLSRRFLWLDYLLQLWPSGPFSSQFLAACHTLGWGTSWRSIGKISRRHHVVMRSSSCGPPVVRVSL